MEIKNIDCRFKIIIITTNSVITRGFNCILALESSSTNNNNNNIKCESISYHSEPIYNLSWEMRNFDQIKLFHCDIVQNNISISTANIRLFTKELSQYNKACLVWCRHQMETFSALLVICAGNSLVTGEFPAQRPVTRSFDAFFDLPLHKRLSKQWRGWWYAIAPIMTSL